MTEDKTKKKGLLQKKIKDLTEEELDSLRIVFGTPDLPFPTLVSKDVETDTGHRSKTYEIGAYASVEDDEEHSRQPLVFYSEKEPEEVLGIFYREMPTPSMLEYMITAMQRMAPESTNRHFCLFGDPGEGKSFMGEMFARAQSDRLPLKIDCGGKNLNELQFEMVLDRKEGESVFDAIDQKIEKGTLSGYSEGELIAYLEVLIYNRLNREDEEDFKVSPAQLKQELSNFVELDETGKHILSADWAAISKDAAREDRDGFNLLIRDIAKAERFDAAGSSAFGMHAEYGANIKAEIEGRMLIKDEYNKSKPGGDDALQTNLQYEVGETNSCILNNPLKDSSSGGDDYVLRREDQKLGTFYWYTGNKKVDGITTRELSKSVQDRLDIKEITAPKEMDFAHRLCQIVTGMPITTMYDLYSKAQGDQFDKDEFREMLLMLREVGLTEEEKKNIPPLQKTLLTNWEDTMNGLKQVAGLIYDYAHELNPANLEDESDGFESLMDEITQEVFDMSAFSFRQLGKLAKEALNDRPEAQAADEIKSLNMIKFDQIAKKRSLPKTEGDDPALNFGTRMVKTLLRKVEETSIQADREAMYGKMMKMAEDRGIVEKTMSEAGKGGLSTVEKLLNQTMYDNATLDHQDKMTQDLICEYLRDTYPDMIATNDNDDIVSKSRVRATLSTLAEKDEHIDGHQNIFLPENDASKLESFALRHAVKVDTVYFDLSDNADNDHNAFIDELEESGFENLVDQKSFLTSLALPKVGDENIKALFAGHYLSKANAKETVSGVEPEEAPVTSGGASMGNPSEDMGDVDQSNATNDNTAPAAPVPEKVNNTTAIQIAENEHESGLAITTLAMAQRTEDGKVKNCKMHMIRNEHQDKTVLVGGQVSKRLSVYFKHKNIVHIPADDPNAKAKVETQLNAMTKGMSENVKDALKQAFLSRNECDDENVSARDLADLLVAKDVRPHEPVWLLQKQSEVIKSMMKRNYDAGKKVGM